MNAVTQWPVVPSESQADAALLSAAFEACPEGLAITENGRILYANSAFSRSLGLSGDGAVRGSLLAELTLDIPAVVQTTSSVFHDSGRDLTIVTARRGPHSKSTVKNSVALETMGRLVSGVAHDFNNLLTGILLYCDLLITALEDRPRLQSQVKEMRGAGELGGALIQQLLTLARHQVAERRPILWNDTIVGLKSFLQRLIGENIELHAELDPH